MPSQSSQPPPLEVEARAPSVLNAPNVRDPTSLPFIGKPVSYITIFVDNFVGLAQEHSNGYHAQQIVLYDIGDVFHPIDSSDNACRRHPMS